MDDGVSEAARFLALRPPFDALAPEELGQLLEETELEFYVRGATILSEDGGPVTFLRVIHSGGVDIVHDGKLLDLLGPGDTFGHDAMLSGLPPGFEARASQDTLCYRVPVAAARPLLERARSRELEVGVNEPGHHPVAMLIRSPTIVCEPMASIREVARRMTSAGASCAIVNLQDGSYGIITDRDLRTRVVAGAVPLNGPVAGVMTTPVFAVTPDRTGAEVLFEMLERSIRHAVVVSEGGALVGTVEDSDLFAIQPRSWFGARRSIARAGDLTALAEVSLRLPSIVADLHASNLRALEVVRVLSALVDAVVGRALELVAREVAVPADGLVWVTLGSHARRELTPASDTQGAVVCSDPPSEAWLGAASAALHACGLHRAPVLARSPSDWIDAAVADDELALAVLVDRRALWGTPREALPVAEGRAREPVLSALLRRALLVSPPTGFDADVVIEADGRRHEQLDIRRATVVPIVALARWAGAAAGGTQGSTEEQLRAGAAAGVLSEADAGTLADAFELALDLRIGHHIAQLAAGETPNDLIDPATISPLMRDHLRDVFRAVAAVQRGLDR